MDDSRILTANEIVTTLPVFRSYYGPEEVFDEYAEMLLGESGGIELNWCGALHAWG